MPFAIDRETSTTFADGVERLDGHPPDSTRLIQPELVFNDLLVACKPMDGLTAVTTTCTRPHLPRLQNDDPEPAVGQVDGSRQARNSRADDGHVAVR